MITEEQKRALLDAAKSVLSFAYAPYSKTYVAAALLDDTGRIHTGVNVENASFGLTICAERNAVGAMISAGGKRIMAVLITSNRGAIPPCGACRQVISEFADDETPIFLADEGGVTARFTIDELLPEAFKGRRDSE